MNEIKHTFERMLADILQTKWVRKRERENEGKIVPIPINY